MHPRTFLRIVVLLLALAVNAEARIEILKARYGSDASGYYDVRAVIDAYIRHNQLSFLISSESMGVRQQRGQRYQLKIEYNTDGEVFRDTVRDGDVFTFQGGRGFNPLKPLLGLSLFLPPPPSTATIEIINQRALPVSVYSLDRFRTWTWNADVQPGQSFVATATVGQNWKIIEDREGGTVLSSVIVERGGNRVTLAGNEERRGRFAPLPASRSRMQERDPGVAFENRYGTAVWLWKYSPRQEKFVLIADIAPGDEFREPSTADDSWIATDHQNRPVTSRFGVKPGEERVIIDGR
jgi:hypothetical protein